MLCVLFAIVSMLFATTNAPSRVAVDGAYEFQTADSIGGVTLFGSLASGLAAISGDSVMVLNDYGPKTHKGWEDILITNALAGDSAAVSTLEVIVRAFDKNDSLISSTICDTIVAAGGAVLIPFGRSSGYFGDHFDVWLKSAGSSGELEIQRFYHFWRRSKQISNAIW